MSLAFRTGLASGRWVDRGISDDARAVRSLLSTASEFSHSIAIGEPKRAAQVEIDLAFKNAQVDDWDGLGSAAVEPNTHAYASYFWSLLPSRTPMPDIWADRDSEICLEWDMGPRRVFSVCVGRDGTLTFAALFGHRKNNGVEHIEEALPETVSTNLNRITAASSP